MPASIRTHHGGWFLGLALLGLVLPFMLVPFGLAGVLLAPLAPVLCIAAFSLGRSELIGMQAGSVAPSGRLLTRIASGIGLVGALLWSILLMLMFMRLGSGAGVGPL